MEHRQIRDAIGQLPNDLPEVIVLREYEELSYRDIAVVLDCPVGTVMSRLARKRATLRNLLSAVFQTST
jgi:RNA polymerase sigma-70 factor (ECF subfamily)